jgi:putative methyltransferase
VEDLAKRPEGEEGEIDMCRYVRWNPNVDLHRKGDWSLAALHAHLAKKGFKRADETVYPIPDKTYLEDEHLGEEVLVFAGKTNWWVKDEWYDAGAVILQDKASCMPAKVLMYGWENGDKGQCIDAT